MKHCFYCRTCNFFYGYRFSCHFGSLRLLESCYHSIDNDWLWRLWTRFEESRTTCGSFGLRKVDLSKYGFLVKVLWNRIYFRLSWLTRLIHSVMNQVQFSFSGELCNGGFEWTISQVFPAAPTKSCFNRLLKDCSILLLTLSF